MPVYAADRNLPGITMDQLAINTLAGLRVEDPAIFDATHELADAAHLAG